MGIAITALSDAYRLVRHNPIILAVGWIAAVLLGVANVVLGIIPLIGRLISLFLLPMFLAGMLALIYNGRNGDASVNDFVDGVGDHYLPLLGSSFLFGVVVFVTALVGLLVPMFVLPMGTDFGLGGPEAMIGAFLVPIAIVGLVLFVFGLLFQFYDAAIVVDDASVLSAFGRSFDVFSSAPLSVLGYTVLRGVIGALFFVAPIAALLTAVTGLLSYGTTAGSGGDLLGAAGITVLAGGLVYLFLLIPLGQVVTLTYHVAFYNRFKATGN